MERGKVGEHFDLKVLNAARLFILGNCVCKPK